MPKIIMSAKDISDRSEWLKHRLLGIGGSDAAAVVGLSRWKSPFQLWQEKRGEVQPDDISDRECVYWGNTLEQAVANRFCELTGKRVHRTGLWADTEHPFMQASPDRLVVGEQAGLECKTANGFAARDWEGDEIPTAYYVQCQHYMMVMGVPRWYIAVLIGGQHFVWKTIERNDDDIAALRRAEFAFWNDNVIGGKMPPVDGTTSCSAALAERFRETVPETTTLGRDAIQAIESIRQLEEHKKGAAARIDELKNQLRLAMGEYEVGVAGDYKVTWKASKPRITLDSKALKADLPDVYAKYAKEGASTRVLRIS